MVHVQVSGLVFVDVDLKVAVVILSSGSHNNGVTLANGVVFFLFLAIREGIRVLSLFLGPLNFFLFLFLFVVLHVLI